ncbi:RNA polymerase sigma factor [Bacillus sp. B-jedd]|uniref:RNA polymerase sigma factor n=1 Tax=Bacillus sp. B-jedd TaxID=1476857 RepID=UPI000515646C|nr:RNA polymerase sigma factor [Bacillus sp. B-jedd]CEG27106.1 ECF subfamily RNA polymerase sigma-24 subunit [Bacillus sp. B-jedd]
MGEQVDIETLFKDYHRDIYQFCLYFTNSVQDAEDITQETFIKAIKNIGSLSDPERGKYWLLAIARNTAIDHLRKRKMKEFLPDFFDKIISGDQSLDEQILRREEWEEVHDALRKMKPHYRAMMILRGIQELTVSETAEILGITALKVRVDFHRAVKILKKEMQDRDRRVIKNEYSRRIDS